MDVHDVIRQMRRSHVLVEITITVDEVEAFWIVENAEAAGISPQRMVSRIVSDVIRDDMLAHGDASAILH